MITDPSEYLSVNPGFSLFDIFGSKRIQEAIDTFDNLRFTKNTQIENARRTLNRQCSIIKKLTDENDILKQAVREKDSEIERLAVELEKQKRRTTLSESAKTSSSNALEKLSEENTNLKMQILELSKNYNELADLHDDICECIKRGDLDIPIEKFERRRKAS